MLGRRMLRETFHFLWHAPNTLWHKVRLSQADLYDVLMTRAEARGLAERRRVLAAGAQGRVLEVGCGTGLLFAHYTDMAQVTAIDPDPTFLEKARERARNCGARVVVEHGDVQELPFEAGTFDTVVVCLVLCSVPSPERALAECARVLAPGGTLRMLEHVVSERPVAKAFMHAVDPLWLAANGQGCHLDRDTLRSVRDAGFTIDEDEPFQLWSPGLPAFPMRFVVARR